MYLSATQILKRLGIDRNKKNADYIRGYFDTDWINISNVDRIPISLYEVHEDWLIETYHAKEWHPKTLKGIQINSVTSFESTILEQSKDIHDLKINHTALVFRAENQDKRILDLESEIAILNNKLIECQIQIDTIINVFRNFNKGE